jgi:cell division protein FtsL
MTVILSMNKLILQRSEFNLSKYKKVLLFIVIILITVFFIIANIIAKTKYLMN